MRGMPRLRAAALLVAVALAAAACSSTVPDGDRTTSPGPSTVTPAPVSPVPSPAVTTAAPSPSSSVPAPTAEPTSAAPTTARPPAPSPSGVPAAWAGKDVEVLPTDRKVVALTFDGGASNTAADRILATLSAYGVPATFFVTGQFARRYPQTVRAMAAAGHPVGNHSDTHPSFADSTNVVIRQELSAAEAAITALTGRPARPLFRFPFGARTALDIRVVNAAGYIPFRWTVDTLGWAGTERNITAAVVCDRVLGAARPGEIVLMHVGANPDDGTTFDADALPCVIEGLRQRGYGFVSLREFVG